jgi:hypothetical protein
MMGASSVGGVGGMFDPQTYGGVMRLKQTWWSSLVMSVKDLNNTSTWTTFWVKIWRGDLVDLKGQHDMWAGAAEGRAGSDLSFSLR